MWGDSKYEKTGRRAGKVSCLAVAILHSRVGSWEAGQGIIWGQRELLETTNDHLIKVFHALKAIFFVRNMNSHSGQAGQWTQIFPRGDYLQGQEACSLGRDPFPGMHSIDPGICLLVACVPWCCSLVGTPTNLFLSTCMAALPVLEARVLQQKAFSATAPCVPALERMADPGAPWMEPYLGQRLQLPGPDRDPGDWSVRRGSVYPRRCPWSSTKISR